MLTPKAVATAAKEVAVFDKTLVSSLKSESNAGKQRMKIILWNKRKNKEKQRTALVTAGFPIAEGKITVTQYILYNRRNGSNWFEMFLLPCIQPVKEEPCAHVVTW